MYEQSINQASFSNVLILMSCSNVLNMINADKKTRFKIMMYHFPRWGYCTSLPVPGKAGKQAGTPVCFLPYIP
jgi:hypothetical protein